MKHEEQYQETVTKTRTTVFCDDCGAVVKNPNVGSVCSVCRKDICPKCRTWQYNDPFDNDDNGDYPPCVCCACDDLLASRRAAYRAIMDEAYDRASVIRDAAYAECRAKHGPKPE